MIGKNMISIVIPVFNSEKTISDLVIELITNISENHQLEVILVNDCSNDSTLEILKGLYSKIKVQNLHSNP